MKDRVPVNPGRVLITPESGNPYYATLTRADNPTQEGDPLNKNTFLKDETAALLGIGADALPDDALRKLKSIITFGTTAPDGSDMADGDIRLVTGEEVSAGTGAMYFKKEGIVYGLVDQKTAKIETGSYIGTGTGGRDNHTILTFSFAPKLVIITKYNSDNNYHNFPWRDGTLINMEALKQAINSGSSRPKFAVMYDASNTVGADASITNDGKTLDWYVWEAGSEVPKKQLNASGVVYDYIAIG